MQIYSQCIISELSHEDKFERTPNLSPVMMNKCLIIVIYNILKERHYCANLFRIAKENNAANSPEAMKWRCPHKQQLEKKKKQLEKLMHETFSASPGDNGWCMEEIPLLAFSGCCFLLYLAGTSSNPEAHGPRAGI